MIDFRMTWPYSNGWVALYAAKQVIETEMNACMDECYNVRDGLMCELEQPSKWSRKKKRPSNTVTHIHRMA